MGVDGVDIDGTPTNDNKKLITTIRGLALSRRIRPWIPV